MERPVPLPRGTRPQTRHCYEGFVDKRGPSDQGYRRVWAGLRGLTLAFYRGPRDHEPLEVLDLRELVAVRAEGGAVILRLRGQVVTMKMESWEMQELWRGFILTMTKMQVPPDLALLPGHFIQLQEALQEERERRNSAVFRVTPASRVTPVSPTTPVSPAAPVSPGVLVSPIASEPLPRCFFEVSRPEAERLLERSGGRGNFLLRPGGHGQGVSVTTRQELNGAALLKHYRVKRDNQGYVIDVETPLHCSSLAEVVQLFVEGSRGSLQPLYPEYSSHLEFVQADRTPGPAAPAPQPAPRRRRGPPGLGGGPEEQIYMNDPGGRAPPSRDPRPAPPRAPLAPLAHGRTEEMLRKAQLCHTQLKDGQEHSGGAPQPPTLCQQPAGTAGTVGTAGPPSASGTAVPSVRWPGTLGTGKPPHVWGGTVM